MSTMTNKNLLVDDEKPFLKALELSMAHLSDIFETDICFSVPEAIKRIKKNDYDLIVTDLRMPKKSGIDLLLYLKINDFSGEIMVMTANTNEENLKKLNTFGIVDVISKPFDLNWFKAMLIDFFKN